MNEYEATEDLGVIGFLKCKTNGKMFIFYRKEMSRVKDFLTKLENGKRKKHERLLQHDFLLYGRSNFEVGYLDAVDPKIDDWRKLKHHYIIQFKTNQFEYGYNLFSYWRNERERHREYYWKNRTETLKRKKKWRTKNNEKFNAHVREYRKKNRQHYNENQRKWRNKNKDKVKIYNKTGREKILKKNPSYFKDWHRKNKQEVKND